MGALVCRIELNKTKGVIITVENAALETLEWTVSSLPEWLELISPLSTFTGPGEVLMRVKDTAPTGSFNGEIEIESNGGSETVAITLTVQEPPTLRPHQSRLRQHLFLSHRHQYPPSRCLKQRLLPLRFSLLAHQKWF